MADLTATNKVLPPYCNPDLDPKVPALSTGTYNASQYGAAYGGKRKTRRRSWSRKYKRSINCRKPRGFSQKQYCKHGRKSKSRRLKTRSKRYRR
jgi:hypothetical protein|tara:strand:- start:162 stop:443 length:282 start_codon:yes stop_codon:yes gene_type:complete